MSRKTFAFIFPEMIIEKRVPGREKDKACAQKD
jgi:hypothetical protein